MPADSLTIRPAAPEDVDAVVALWDGLTADQNRYVRKIRRTRANREAMRAHLLALVPHGQVLVLEGEGRLWGFAAVVVDLPALDFYYASATVSDLYVAPERRGQGWGRRLLEAAVGMIRESGLHAVTISVAAGNAGAIALYRKLGFLPMEQRLLLPLDSDYVRVGRQGREG